MEVYQDSLVSFRPSYPAFLLHNGNGCSDFILKHGIPERDLIEWAKQFVHSNTVFVDCGAHCGTWAIILAPLCLKVFAFEAQRRTYLQLCGGIALNNMDASVFPYHVALGNQDDKVAHLSVISHDGGGSSLLECSQPISVEKIQMKRLDAFGELFEKQISLIKIDCEGTEAMIIDGARKLLESQKKKYGVMPKIIFECWPHLKQPVRVLLFANLSAIGYKTTMIHGYNNMYLAYE